MRTAVPCPRRSCELRLSSGQSSFWLDGRCREESRLGEVRAIPCTGLVGSELAVLCGIGVRVDRTLKADTGDTGVSGHAPGNLHRFQENEKMECVRVKTSIKIKVQRLSMRFAAEDSVF